MIIKFFLCSKSYIANSNQKEVHPSVDFVGQETADWFADNFGLTAKESIALLGAHTLGNLDPRNSMFKYFWTRNDDAFLNNRYYKGLVGNPSYLQQCVLDSSKTVHPILTGGIDGSPAPVSI